MCSTCYEAIRNNPSTCASCEISQPLIATNEAGRGICGPCSGAQVDYFCRRCGQGGRLYAEGECVRCVLAQRLNDLLTDDDGLPHPQLGPFLQALAEVEHPVTILGWLRKSVAAKALAEMARTKQPITHESLDALPPHKSLLYLRAALTHTGVLEERNEHLEGLAAWLEHELADEPAERARLVRTFMHWHLLRRARRRAQRREFTTGSSRFARRQIRNVLRLPTWLDGEDGSLAELTQADLDQWLLAGPNERRDVRYFLAWAADRNLCRRLRVDSAPVMTLSDLSTEDERWRCLKRCLVDDSLPLDVRAAGALVAIFGVPLSKIVRLTINDLDARGDEVRLTLDKSPFTLPPRLAAVLRTLASTSTPRAAVGRAIPTPWIFPGGVPGRPLSVSSLSNRLREHDIVARPTRHAALLALAEDLPPVVFATLLGVHIATAERWAKIACHDWAGYVAAWSSMNYPTAEAEAGGDHTTVSLTSEETSVPRRPLDPTLPG